MNISVNNTILYHETSDVSAYACHNGMKDSVQPTRTLEILNLVLFQQERGKKE